MFSGLIQDWGSVVEVRHLATGGVTLLIAAPSIKPEDVALGDSIAIDGVCLTATSFVDQVLSFDVIPETLQCSTMGAYAVGQRVNLELSLRVVDKQVEGQGFRVTLERPARLARYIVEKGYVAIDGISLTVASVNETHFTIALIPETAERTTFTQRNPGSFVNLEVDPIARYVCDVAAGYGGPAA
jgi:riboflavin synthase